MKRLIFLALWTALVVTISVSVWSAIKSAGTEVFADNQPQNVAPQTTVVRHAASATARPRHHNTHRSRPRPSASPIATPTARPTTARPRATKTPTPAPDAVTRIWSGAAGTVVAQCTGPSITLKGANPNSGWTMRVERGSREIQVKFTQGEREIEVQATCSRGVPAFEVSSDH